MELLRLAHGNLATELSAALDAAPAALNAPIVGGLYDSRSLLMCAASKGHEEVVRLLVGRGANLSHADKRGATAATLARKQGHGAVADFLEDTSRHVLAVSAAASTAPAEEGSERQQAGTPTAAPAQLLQLVLHGQAAELARALDAAPAALDAPIEGGLYDSRSLLMCAAAKGHEEVVRLLVGRGANLSHADKRGATAATLATKQGYGTIAGILSGARSGGAKKRAREEDAEQGSSSGDEHRPRGVAPAPASSLAAPAPAPAPAAPSSLADELTKLQSLLVAGVLTQGEFEAAKGRLLGVPPAAAAPPPATAATPPSAGDVTVVLHLGEETWTRRLDAATRLDQALVLLSADAAAPLAPALPRDARGENISDPSSRVDEVWLEHGETADGSFDDDLHVWCEGA